MTSFNKLNADIELWLSFMQLKVAQLLLLYRGNVGIL